MDKVKRIIIEFESGKQLGADGAHADKIWSWWESCEKFCALHNFVFSGEPLDVLQKDPSTYTPEINTSLPRELR